MITHVDMDAFYASVEQLDTPELKGRCVIVGGTTHRGVVSAASYEARKHGIHSAMPIFQAKQTCPQGIFLPPRMQRYKTISRNIMAILKTVSPLVEMVSIDEAYIDISGCSRRMGTSREVAMTIKETIRQNIGLTCSVGVAPVRFLAKIASDMDKPDGLTVIHPSQVNAFIKALPIQKVPGVGQKSQQALKCLGIRFLGDIQRYPEEMLVKRLGKFGHRLIHLAQGIDTTPVATATAHKQVSSERTLARDTMDPHYLKQILLQQSGRVSKALRKRSVRAKVVILKLKYANFQQVTRRKTLETPTQSTEAIYQEAIQLLEKDHLTQKVRLVGVGASGFIRMGEPLQMSLFDQAPAQNQSWEKVDRAIDHISKKFGKDLVHRASLPDPSKKESPT